MWIHSSISIGLTGEIFGTYARHGSIQGRGRSGTRRVVALLFLAACARPDYAERRPDYLALAAGPRLGYAIKRVVDKENPFTLVSDDGTLCRTSSERYKHTNVKTWIACSWALPAVSRTRIAEITSR